LRATSPVQAEARIRVLAFGAHPDDVEIGCGGLIAALTQRGHHVVSVAVTSGEAGSQTIPRDRLTEIREAEATQAARILGIAEMIFLRLEDGFTSFSREDKVRVIDLVRSQTPEFVLVHASSDRFPDHSLVHRLVMEALLGAAGPWYQEASGQPWKPATVLGYEVWHPMPDYQLSVPIEATLEAKIAALRCHQSQLSEIAYDQAFEALARYRGVLAGGSYAEVFEVLQASAQPLLPL
jgi:LmbE family N-acetylglucosaminyl deacetylase